MSDARGYGLELHDKETREYVSLCTNEDMSFPSVVDMFVRASVAIGFAPELVRKSLREAGS